MQRKILPIWLLNDPFLKTFLFVQMLKKKPLNLYFREFLWLVRYLDVHIVSIMAQRYIFKRSLLATIMWQKKLKYLQTSLKFLFSIQLLAPVLMQRIHFTGFLNLIKKK